MNISQRLYLTRQRLNGAGRGIELRVTPTGETGKRHRTEKRRRRGRGHRSRPAAQPPPAERTQRQDAKRDRDKPAAQGRAPLVATKVQVGLEEPIWRAKVQTSVTSRWT